MASFWNLLKSGFNYLFGLIFSVGPIKFLIFTAFYWLLTKLFDIAKAILGGVDYLAGLPGLIGGLPADFLFYLKLFRVDIGLPMIVAAMVVKFTIRRLPIIG